VTEAKKKAAEKKLAEAKPKQDSEKPVKAAVKKTEAKPMQKEKKESKAIAKADVKAEAKKPAEKKAVPAKAKKKVKAKPTKKGVAKKEKKTVPKSKEVKALAAKIAKKKKLMFRGRFGNRSIRRIGNKKWQRWKKPRGIDIYFKQEDGLYPKTGYRTALEIRSLHPSGYRAELVSNKHELEALEGKKGSAALLSKKLGKKKRAVLVKKAEKIGVRVLNW